MPLGHQKTDIDTELTLLAHIHNDEHLLGARRLEGALFQNTVSKLVEFIENNERAAWHQQLKLKTNFKENMCRFLESLGKQDKPQDIVDSILKHSNYFMAGGWKGFKGESGHAMVYEFQLQQEGDLLFIVHNTGAGLQYHASRQTPDEDQIYPVKLFRIKNFRSQLADPFFRRSFTLFLEKIDPDENKKKDIQVDAKTLYLDYFESIYRSPLMGEEIDRHHRSRTKRSGGTKRPLCLPEHSPTAVRNMRPSGSLCADVTAYIR